MSTELDVVVVDRLTELAVIINAEHAACGASLLNALEHAMNCGDALIEARAAADPMGVVELTGPDPHRDVEHAHPPDQRPLDTLTPLERAEARRLCPGVAVRDAVREVEERRVGLSLEALLAPVELGGEGVEEEIALRDRGGLREHANENGTEHSRTMPTTCRRWLRLVTPLASLEAAA